MAFDWKTVTVCLSLLCLPILFTISVLALPLILVLYMIAWAVHLKLAQTDASFNLPYYPSRVFKLNLALADYFFSIISLTPQIVTYLIWRYWKSGPSSGSEGVLRGIPYSNDGHKDHTLDLYLPVSVQTGTANKVFAPIIVFVYGGSWFAGSKNQYGLLADMIRRMGYIVVVPDYRKYPLVKAQGMYDDLRLALEFIGDKAESWGGDLERIFVAGHSAGAQIAAQVVLSAVVNESRARAADITAASGSTPSFKINGQPNGVPRMPRIEGLLLMAGVYDIASHYEFETSRGVELVSAMGRAMGGTPESFVQNSPLHLLPNSHITAKINANGNANGHGNGNANGHGNGHLNGHGNGNINGNVNGNVNGNFNGNININGNEHNHDERKEEDIEIETAAMSKCLAETMPRIMFVHGEKDVLVPVSSTVEFYKAIGNAIRTEDRDEVDVRVRLYKRMGHGEVITALMSNYFFRNRSTGSLVSDLKDFIEPESFEDDY